MENKAYVFANENALCAQYGWVYLFVPEVCEETDLGVEVIDLDTYNRYYGSRSMLKKCRTLVHRNDLAPMPKELLEKYEACMYDNDGKDTSDEMTSIYMEVIEAAEVMNFLHESPLKIADDNLLLLNSKSEFTVDDINNFFQILLDLDDEIEAGIRCSLALKIPSLKKKALTTKIWIDFARKYKNVFIGKNENFINAREILKKRYNLK
jgi:L-ribulose-5-phosphate 3-epimerase UlaE